MGCIILTSGPQFSVKKENGDHKAIKLANESLAKILKEEVEKYDDLLFICSSPDDYKKNEEYCDIITKSLSLAGIKFQRSDLIDSRNWLFSKGLINTADLVILLGGNPIEQMDFFNSIELREKIKKYRGCLMGISAGSLNMGIDVYCSEDKEIEETCYYKGLGLLDLTIEPHFEVSDIERINNVLLRDSMKRAFVALPDESFIFMKKNKMSLYGDAYYFNKGKYEKIKSFDEISK